MSSSTPKQPHEMTLSERLIAGARELQASGGGDIVAAEPPQPEPQPGESLADANRLGYVGSTKRDSNAWFTPDTYLDAARAALGGTITLDPFSSTEANRLVKAETYWTAADDAFAQDWSVASGGTVWMNPPYSGTLVAQATNRFMDEHAAGSFAAGVFLVNNSTETRWFQRALREATGMCLTDHRISFWNADGKRVTGNTRGQAFLYFGGGFDLFAGAFAGHGAVLRLGGGA